MSNCIARELLKRGKTVLYQTAPVLLDTVIDYKMNKQKDYKEDILKSVLGCDLLIIDDLGTESLNSMKLSELFNIINTRILNLNQKITIIRLYISKYSKIKVLFYILVSIKNSTFVFIIFSNIQQWITKPLPLQVAHYFLR